jgi:hypothetical protein
MAIAAAAAMADVVLFGLSSLGVFSFFRHGILIARQSPLPLSAVLLAGGDLSVPPPSGHPLMNDTIKGSDRLKY